MGLISWATGRSGGVERRGLEWEDVFGSDRPLTQSTASGVDVTTDVALKFSAVFACATLIADIAAMMPLEALTGVGADQRLVPNQPVWMSRPNAEQTDVELWFSSVMSAALTGVAFFEVIPHHRTGAPFELIPINPHAVNVQRIPGSREIRYDVSLEDGSFAADVPHVTASEPGGILHIRRFPWPGNPRGLSPMEYIAETVGRSIAAADQSSKFFQNDSRPSAVIEVPGELGVDSMARLRSGWEEHHRGSKNAYRVGILSAGAKLNTYGVSPGDAQLIETQRFGVEEILRAYRVPGWIVNSMEKSTSWGQGMAEQRRALHDLTVHPWLRSYEASLTRWLLPRGQEAKWNTSTTTRLDDKTRFETLATATGGPVMTVNEARAREGLSAVDGGDTLRTAPTTPSADPVPDGGNDLSDNRPPSDDQETGE